MTFTAVAVSVSVAASLSHNDSPLALPSCHSTEKKLGIFYQHTSWTELLPSLSPAVILGKALVKSKVTPLFMVVFNNFLL